MNKLLNRALHMGASLTIIGVALASTAAHAETPAPATETKRDVPVPGIAEGSDIVVTATRANEIAPVTASLQTTQPQSIVSRSFIEDSLPKTADFNQIALISPSVSNFGGTNGVGLSESKAQIRGFQDAEYNITYDGVPFGDTNDPSHHSNTFFPSNTIETLIIDRGPGNASQLGQATFGGNFNLFSRETRSDPGIEATGSYGSFNTYLVRGLVQSGGLDALGGTQIVLSGQHVRTDGARSFSPYEASNIFGKIVVPITPDVKLTVLGTYSYNKFNQPDNDGVTLAQIALYGKDFSLNTNPNSQANRDYNPESKKTDFEIIKFEAHLSDRFTFENRLYTYAYQNLTTSGNDVTVVGTAGEAAANVVRLTPTGALEFGVPGYTKTNQYRVYGDIAKLHVVLTDFARLTVGGWIEQSDTYRQQRTINLVTGARNYSLTNTAAQVNTPRDVRYDQNSSFSNGEEFVELEIEPIAGLKITPGFKHVDFTRKIDALYNQTTRIPAVSTASYSADLPFVTANYAITERLSTYFQYAKGFLPPLLNTQYVVNPGLSSLEPQKSTNYQIGAVYHGPHLSLDFDLYQIEFSNKITSFTSSVPGQGVIFVNSGKALYKGIEGQVTYAFDFGLALFANGSLNYARTANNPAAPATDLYLPRAPKSTAAAGILYKDGPIRFSLIDKYTGVQYADTGNTLRLEGYNTAIVSGSYDIGPVRLGIQVTNLTDSRKVTNISGTAVATRQYFFQAPREITGTATLRF
ncbi:TonB-dependent receptor [Sphingomonas sp. 28-63-12]|uniref:TonB-dependent receptor n=1 Tax=Sphingomonas sp. 28-63-12 TaxID=1970434 RepID=UPI000BCF43BE|nr:MAG: TonB-dependent receptor [Sphingomonas sp. 28-63-12]